jgi:hypothetical protein
VSGRLSWAGAEGRARRGRLRCVLRLQPSPASQTYTVTLTYRHGRHPQVSVTDPSLTLYPGATALPHVYPGNELCLSYPGEWTHNMLLAHTIVPWTSEWLLHYELWLITGQWAGGGHSYTARDRTPQTRCGSPGDRRQAHLHVRKQLSSRR